MVKMLTDAIDNTLGIVGGASARKRVRRSPWFDAATQQPTRCGWYEVRSIGWPGAQRGYWNGERWHAWEPQFPTDGAFFLGLYRDDRWRGLLAA